MLDVIPSPPNQQCKVFFESGAYLKGGDKLTPKQARTQPLIQWKSKPKKFYTVCMCDPDAVNKEFQHWLVGNVPGNNVCMGQTLTEYIGPFPKKDTGIHHYVILVFLQEKAITFTEDFLNSKSVEGRSNFSVAKFADTYSLGNPVAGNVFEAEYDDFVAILQTELGIDEETDKKKKKKKKKK